MFETITMRFSRWTRRLADLATGRKSASSGDAPTVIPEESPRTDTGRDAWKEKALADFTDWLEALPESPPPAEALPAESCDLYTLLTEFTALRQEIRMQNREQHRSLHALEEASGQVRQAGGGLTEAAGDYRRAMEAVDVLVLELKTATDRMNRFGTDVMIRETEKRTVTPFLDIRDALTRGLDAARSASEARGIFIKPPKEMAGVIEGYEMALRRFDRALAAMGIRPLITKGAMFDPATMRAVETRNRPDLEKGCVVEELLGGFARGDEVIRTAEVIVNA